HATLLHLRWVDGRGRPSLHFARATVGSSWLGIRCWLRLSPVFRSAIPWLLLETAGSGLCAGPRFAAGLLWGSAALLFWCRSVGCRWLGRFACRPACGRG